MHNTLRQLGYNGRKPHQTPHQPPLHSIRIDFLNKKQCLGTFYNLLSINIPLSFTLTKISPLTIK